MTCNAHASISPPQLIHRRHHHPPRAANTTSRCVLIEPTRASPLFLPRPRATHLDLNKVLLNLFDLHEASKQLRWSPAGPIEPRPGPPRVCFGNQLYRTVLQVSTPRFEIVLYMSTHHKSDFFLGEMRRCRESRTMSVLMQPIARRLTCTHLTRRRGLLRPNHSLQFETTTTRTTRTPP